MTLVVASASLAAAVSPTVVPMAGVLIDRIGRSVCVCNVAHIELVDVVDIDRKLLIGITNRPLKWLVR